MAFDKYIGPKEIGKKKKILEKMSGEKSLATLLKELQEVFNEFIRLRDTRYDKGKPYFICISCGQPKGLDQMNAGHFFSVGGFPALRFDEDNCAGQCIACNCYQHGNLLNYRTGLIKKIGQKRFEILELRSRNRSKLMAFEVKVLLDQYKGKVAELKSQKENKKI